MNKVYKVAAHLSGLIFVALFFSTLGVTVSLVFLIATGFTKPIVISISIFSLCLLLFSIALKGIELHRKGASKHEWYAPKNWDLTYVP